MLRGATQGFQLSQNLVPNSADSGMDHMDCGEGDESMEMSGHKNHARSGGMTIKDQEWAVELRRADERANEIRHKYDELV